MNRNESLELLRRYVSDENLIIHSIATAAIMKSLANKFSTDQNEWETIGILHDIDYSIVEGDLNKHGEVGYNILIKEEIPENIALIVKRHNYHIYNGTYTEPIEISLQAADSISGLIIACALIKKGNLSEVTPKTVKKKFKDKSFAAGCDRDRIKSIEQFMELEEFYKIAIQGLLSVKEEIGFS